MKKIVAPTTLRCLLGAKAEKTSTLSYAYKCYARNQHTFTQIRNLQNLHCAGRKGGLLSRTSPLTFRVAKRFLLTSLAHKPRATKKSKRRLGVLRQHALALLMLDDAFEREVVELVVERERLRPRPRTPSPYRGTLR